MFKSKRTRFSRPFCTLSCLQGIVCYTVFYFRVVNKWCFCLRKSDVIRLAHSDVAPDGREWCDVCPLCRRHNITAKGYIIRRSRHHLPVRANIVRRTCFFAGRRFEFPARFYKNQTVCSHVFYACERITKWGRILSSPCVIVRSAISCNRQSMVSFFKKSGSSPWDCFPFRFPTGSANDSDSISI